MWYIVYNSTTGEILRTGYTSSGSIESQAGTGESVMEGQAASDGSKMVDITETPPVVIDNPDWEAPAAVTPKSNVADLLERIERLENPFPSSITVTFSGIVNNGATDDPNVTGQAEDFNDTFALTQNSAGSHSYTYTSGEKTITITMEQGTYTGYIMAQFTDAINNGTAFYFGGLNVQRGKTIASLNSDTSDYDSHGNGGVCTIL